MRIRSRLRLLLLSIAVVALGCQAQPKKEGGKANSLGETAPDDPASVEVRAGQPKADAEFAKPLWLVEPFNEKAKWDEGLEDSVTTIEWGKRLSVAIESRLQAVGKSASAVDHELSREEINTLMARGLEYLCGGEIQKLDRADVATLTVKYKLYKKREAKGEMVGIKTRTLSFGAPVRKTLQVEDMQTLIDGVAGKVVEQLNVDIPQDLLAERG